MKTQDGVGVKYLLDVLDRLREMRQRDASVWTGKGPNFSIKERSVLVGLSGRHPFCGCVLSMPKPLGSPEGGEPALAVRSDE